MEFTRLTLTLVVPAKDANEVEDELNQALDVIGAEYCVYDDKIESEDAGIPEECDEDEED